MNYYSTFQSGSDSGGFVDQYMDQGAAFQSGLDCGVCMKKYQMNYYSAFQSGLDCGHYMYLSLQWFNAQPQSFCRPEGQTP